MWIGLMIALFAGIFISVQSAINGMVGSKVGVMPVVMIPVSYQVIIYVVALLSTKKTYVALTEITTYPAAWWYLILSAFLGIGIMLTLTLSVMKIGPLLGLAVVVFSQLGMSMVIEHFGFFEMTKRTLSMNRVVGLGLMILGVVFFARK